MNQIPTTSFGDPWENLANSIIVTAAEDYRKAKKRLKRHPEDGHARYTFGVVSTFLQSAYFSQLSNADGKQILQKLQEEIV